MAAFADLSELVNRKTGGNNGNPDYFLVTKEWRIGSTVITTVASQMQSGWSIDGNPSGGATPPPTSAYCDNTTVGGFRQASPGGGRQKFLDYVCAVASTSAELIIVDRLFHSSGMNGTLITPQVVPTPVSGAMRGPANGVGNQIFLEIYSLLGTTSVVVTVAYTNQDNASKSTTFVIGGTGRREATIMVPIPLAPGDTGVRSVQSVTLTTSTGTAGDFGVTIVRPLLHLSCLTGGSPTSRSIIDGPIFDVSQSCLTLIVFPSSASSTLTSSIFVQMVER